MKNQNKRRSTKTLLFLGVAGLLFPYVSFAAQMGNLLVQHWEHPRWWILLASVCFLVTWCFWVQTRMLLTLEKQLDMVPPILSDGPPD